MFLYVNVCVCFFFSLILIKLSESISHQFFFYLHSFVNSAKLQNKTFAYTNRDKNWRLFFFNCLLFIFTSLYHLFIYNMCSFLGCIKNWLDIVLITHVWARCMYVSDNNPAFNSTLCLATREKRRKKRISFFSVFCNESSFILPSFYSVAYEIYFIYWKSEVSNCLWKQQIKGSVVCIRYFFGNSNSQCLILLMWMFSFW